NASAEFGRRSAPACIGLPNSTRIAEVREFRPVRPARHWRRDAAILCWPTGRTARIMQRWGCEMWPFTGANLVVPRPEDCLPGREAAMPVPERHFVNGHRLTGPYREGLEQAVFGLGCFWGAERVFWQAPGVWVTAVGYAGGTTPNPTYEEVCSGRTGHAEVV